MSIKMATYVLQLLEVWFLCRRKKLPITALVTVVYIGFAYACLTNIRFTLDRFWGYVISFGIAMHYVLLITVSFYVAVWFIFRQWDVNYIYSIQSYVIIVSLIITAYGYCNSFSVDVNHYVYETDKVTKDVRIIQLSDLHLCNIFDAGELHRLVEAVNELKPDIICITGDIFTNKDAMPKDMNAIYEEFSRLNPTYGTYVCQGNHDINLSEELRTICNKSGMTLLIDDSSIVGELEISGRECNLRSEPISGIIKDWGKFTIVMDHRPDRVDEAVYYDVDLLLCGHTHGGQLFPIKLQFYGMYGVCTGTIEYDGTVVVINQGVGLIYPYCRVEGNPEIGCIDIRPK